MPAVVHSQAHFRHLVDIVRNNLEHQQNWGELRVHGLDEGQAFGQPTHKPPPRIMISGLPPRRLYIHPDEQIEILRAELALGHGQRIPQPPEYEWVLPMHLAEKPTLSQFADVFDSVAVLPPGAESEDKPGRPDGPDTAATGSVSAVEQLKQWRGAKRGKRILLAIVQDDSTVIYYYMHDGIVKPRQN